MSYATYPDVKARVGRLAGVFEVDGKHPNQADVEQVLANLSADVDAAIKAGGFDLASLTQGVKDSLRDLVATGAVARVLPAADQSREALAIADRAATVWTAALVALTDRSWPGLAELEAGEGGSTGPAAGSFWDDEPTYGGRASVQAQADLLRDTNLAPGFARGQKL